MAREPTPEERPNDEPKRPPDKEDKKVGWFDDLAQRSTGLPPKVNPNATKGTGGNDKSAWSLSGAGIQFAVTTAVFACIGVFLDRRFGWSPWGTIALSMLGFVG